MKTIYKVLITLGLIVLVGFLVWWFKFRKKSYFHKRSESYIIPNQELVHKKITDNTVESTNKKERHDSTTSSLIPKVIYLTHCDIDAISPNVLETIKMHYNGYEIEIHGSQSCEDFLYKYYGPSVMQLYRELGEEQRGILWGNCILYVRGGKFIYGGVTISSKSHNPDLWKMIIEAVNRISVKQLSGNSDIPFFENKLSSYTTQLKSFHEAMKEIDIKKINLPIIYINLDKATERRQLMEDQLKIIDTPVVRVPGVLIPDGFKKGAKGCFLAHLNAMKELLNQGWDRCLILEDDAGLFLSSRWDLSLSELKYPCWLSQGATAYIIDKWTATDFLGNNQFSTRFSEGIDTIMCERYGDNPMNEWIPYRKKGWVHYFYIYPMIHLTQSQIQGVGRKQMEGDAKRSIDIIKQCRGGLREIKVDAKGWVQEHKVSPVRQIVVSRPVSKIDIRLVRHRYPGTILELYYDNPKYVKDVQEEYEIRLFELYRSNIEDYKLLLKMSAYKGSVPKLVRKGVTTIITTAPQPSIPSPHLLVETVKTLSLIPLFNKSPVIIGFDGCEVNNKLDPKCMSVFSCSEYNRYKENAKREVLKLIPYAVFVELPERGCLSSLLHHCMQSVDTDFVNVMQQDLPIVKKFDAQKVIDAMRGNSSMDLVRYVWKTNEHHEEHTLEACSDILEPRTITIDGLKFTQCSQWSDNNHIAKMEHYIDLVWPNTKPYSFMEHQIQCYPVENQYYKIWYLGEPTDGEYIVHTDGRAVEKYESPSNITQVGNKYIKIYKSEKKEVYHIEKESYMILKDTDIVPPIIANDDELTLIIEEVGVPLSQENMPKDYVEQVSNIMNTFSYMGISHNDLWAGNVMVKNGRIRIIDFEHATWKIKVPIFFKNDNLLDMSSVFFKKISPLYIGTTETLSEIASMCETKYPTLPGTTTLCSVIGGMSVLSLLSNSTINPQKIILYDIDDAQCMVAQVYLELINQADTLTEFIKFLYSSNNATELTLDNMVTQIPNLDGNVRPVFSTKSTHDFYYQKMLPRIMRSKFHEFPTELWPCWNPDADKDLVYPSPNDKSISMYLRGEPTNIKKANTLYYRQGGFLLNNDKFIETKHKLQNAEIHIDTANLRNINTLYKRFNLGKSDNLVFFVSNADQGTQWTDGRDTLKMELEKSKNPTQYLLYVAVDHHDILARRTSDN